MPEYSIIISERGGAEKRLTFSGEAVGIGRVQGNDIVLPKGNVSKRHARISMADGGYVVTDLNSTNGTYVNRRRITQATVVQFGDRIYIGDFVIRIEDPAGSSFSSVTGGIGELRESVPEFSDQTAKTNKPLLPSSRGEGRRDSVPEPSSELSSMGSSQNLSTGEHVPISIEDGAAALGPNAYQVLRALVTGVEARLDAEALHADPSALKAQAERALSQQWDELQASNGELLATVNRAGVISVALAELLDVGRLAEIFEDPSVTQLLASGTHSVVAWRGERRRFEIPFASNASLERALLRLFERHGQHVEPGTHQLQCELPRGVFVSAVLARGESVGTTVRLWKAGFQSDTFDGLVREGALSRGMATFLRQCVAHDANVLFVGERKAVQRLLSAAASATLGRHCLVLHAGSTLCADRNDATRLFTGSPLLGPSVAHLTGVGGVHLVVEHLAPATWNAVFRGVGDGVTGLLAGAAARGLHHWWGHAPIDLSAAVEGLGRDAAQQWLAATFDFVVEVSRLGDDRNRVVDISEVVVGAGGRAEFNALFRFEVERTAAGGDVEGSFRPTGSIPEFVQELRSRGESIDSGVFRAAR